MAGIPPKMLVRFFAIVGIIIFAVIIVIWVFFLVLQKVGQIGNDREDTGGGSWHVIVQPTTNGNSATTFEDIFDQEMEL